MDEDKNTDFEIIQRDALEALQDLPDAAFDALVADPPYCSGGITPAGVATLDANGYYLGVDNSGAYCANSRERLNAAAARLF